MGSNQVQSPEFFEEEYLDPVNAATGKPRPDSGTDGQANSDGNAVSRQRPSLPKPVRKKKAGFYLPVELLDRFSNKFYELKLSGFDIENKSALIEVALAYTLDDMDRGEKSEILKRLQTASD